jgi:hypothetical protein
MIIAKRRHGEEGLKPMRWRERKVDRGGRKGRKERDIVVRVSVWAMLQLADGLVGRPKIMRP